MHERIHKFLRDTFFVDDVDDAASFLRSGIIDSLGVLELVQFLEDEFDLDVVDEDLIPDNLDSVLAVVGFIERKRALVAAGASSAVAA